MTVHKARMVGRFLWHYAEMVIAMMLGMLVLGMVTDAVLPDITRIDVDTLIMAANMTIGMAVWMRVRRHGWPSIAELSLAMFVPFLVVLVPYWFGALPSHLVMTLGLPAGARRGRGGPGAAPGLRRVGAAARPPARQPGRGGDSGRAATESRRTRHDQHLVAPAVRGGRALRQRLQRRPHARRQGAAQ